ncbi:hypothetical protein [Taklimakanibacter deserti]|uniref:hypothetical protein n=1 Tax=Taklimakanibacter deserti TaxID=2267839 RepID=UPI000E648D37
MTVVEPGKGRAIIEQNGAGLRITIPAVTQAFGVIFISLWLIGWAFGEVMVSRQLFGSQSVQNSSQGGSLFMLVWLAAWTLGGGWAIYTLLWQLAGKEIIELTTTSLRQRKQIPLFSRSKEYALANIANLRVAPPRPRFYQGQYMIQGLSFKDGAISFDYGRDTHHLASGLDEADAKYVIGEMCKRVKSLCH